MNGRECYRALVGDSGGAVHAAIRSLHAIDQSELQDAIERLAGGEVPAGVVDPSAVQDGSRFATATGYSDLLDAIDAVLGILPEPAEFKEDSPAAEVSFKCIGCDRESTGDAFLCPKCRRPSVCKDCRLVGCARCVAGEGGG